MQFVSYIFCVMRSGFLIPYSFRSRTLMLLCNVRGSHLNQTKVKFEQTKRKKKRKYSA